MAISIFERLRVNLSDLLHICKRDAFPPGCGWNTTTLPLGRWDMTGGILADTLKAVVVEAENCGLGDRAEYVFLRFLQPMAEPIPAIEEAMRFLERLEAVKRQGSPAAGGEHHEHLVNIQQAAAMVSRSKKTLERRKIDPKFPMPRVAGGGGKPDEYAWSEMRLYLEGEFDRKLPEHFPTAPFTKT